MSSSTTVSLYQKYLLLLPFLLLIFVFMLIPLFAVLVKSLTNETDVVFNVLIKPDSILQQPLTLNHYIEPFLSGYGQRFFWMTIFISLVATVGLVIIGVPVGYFIARSSRWGELVRTIATIPSLEPVVTVAYAFMWFFSTTGVVNYVLYDQLHLTSEPVNLVNCWEAVVLGDICIFSTLAVRMLASLFLMIDPTVEEASRSLGASEFQTFKKIVIPMALPGIAAVSVFVFVRTMGSYVMALILGGGYKIVNVIPLEVYLHVMSAGFMGSMPEASALSIILVAITILGRLFFILFMKRYFSEYFKNEIL